MGDDGGFLVTGGTDSSSSYLARYTSSGDQSVQGEPVVFLVRADEGELAKPYSPALRVNGSVVLADSFHNRVVQVNCVDGQQAPVACTKDAAVSGQVTTLLDNTYYPRAVALAATTTRRPTSSA